MKLNKLARVLTATAVAFSFVSPVSAASVSVTARCAVFGDHMTAVDTQMLDLKARLEAKRGGVSASLTSREEARQAQVNAQRAREDQARVDLNAKLDADAKTPAQVQAVAKFQAAVRTAVMTRRNSVEAANATFHASLTKAIADRKVAVDAAVNKFQAAVRSAGVEAKASCLAKSEVAAMREKLNAAISAARMQLKTDLETADTNIAAEVRAAVEVRKGSQARAMAEFQATLDAAKAELKAAFAA